MLRDRVEYRWIESFAKALGPEQDRRRRCCGRSCRKASRGELNVHSLRSLLCSILAPSRFMSVRLRRHRQRRVPVRSTGASQALQGHAGLLAALKAVPVIVDVTVEGLMHAPELPEILKSGARVITISNEHPEALERLLPNEALQSEVLAASRLCRGAGRNDGKVCRWHGTDG